MSHPYRSFVPEYLPIKTNGIVIHRSSEDRSRADHHPSASRGTAFGDHGHHAPKITVLARSGESGRHPAGVVSPRAILILILDHRSCACSNIKASVLLFTIPSASNRTRQNKSICPGTPQSGAPLEQLAATGDGPPAPAIRE